MEGSIEQLLSVDAATLTLDEQLGHLAELNALLARVSARRERCLAAVADPDDERNWIREEVGCLLRWPFPVAADRLARATHLVRRLPTALGAHEAGLISDDHTRVLAELTYGLDAASVSAVEERVLHRAPTQTRAQFRQSVRRAVANVDPQSADEAHRAASKARAVRLQSLPDGMAGIWSVHKATDAEAIMARLRAIARSRPAGAMTARSTSGRPMHLLRASSQPRRTAIRRCGPRCRSSSRRTQPQGHPTHRAN